MFVDKKPYLTLSLNWYRGPMARDSLTRGVSNVDRRRFLKAAGAGATVVGLAGCTSDPPTADDGEDGDGGDNGDGGGGGGGDATEILFLTSTEESGSTQAAQGIAAVLNENQDDYQINAPPSGGSRQGMLRMGRGEANMAYTNRQNAYNIDQKQEGYEDYPADIEMVFHYYDIWFGILANPESDIQSVADLGGKRVSFGETGGTGHEIQPLALEHVPGLDVDSIEIVPLSYDQTGSALSEGRVDAVLGLFLNDIMPGYVEQNFSLNPNARWLDWPDEAVEGIQNDPLLNGQRQTPDEIGTENGFDGQDEVFFQSAVYHIYTRQEYSADIVYDFLSLMWEHREQTAGYHALAEKWTSGEFMADKFSETIGAHEGAERFFEEIDQDINYT